MEMYERIDLKGCKKFTSYNIQQINDSMIILRNRNLLSLGKIKSKKICRTTNFTRLHFNKIGDNLYKIKKNNRVFLVDGNLNIITDGYYEIESFKKDIAKAIKIKEWKYKRNKYSKSEQITLLSETIINDKGEEIFENIEKNYKYDDQLQSLYELEYKKDYYKDGFVFLSPHFVIINEHEILAYSDKKAVIINRKENKITNIEKKFDIAIDGNNNLISVKKDGKFEIIDTKGNLVIDMKYDSLNLLDNGYYTFSLASSYNRLYGISNIINNFYCKPKYNLIEDFVDDYAIVKYKNKNGLIDKTGREIIKPMYDRVQIKNDIIIASIRNKHHIINTDGIILDAFYSKKGYTPFFTCSNNLLLVNKERDNFCLYNISGKLIIPWFKATIVHIFDDSNIIVDNRIVDINNVKFLYCILKAKGNKIYEYQYKSQNELLLDSSFKKVKKKIY